MTKVNENGQLEWTFEELDLYEEYQNVYSEARKCLDLSHEIDKNSLVLIKSSKRITQEYKDLRRKSHELYMRYVHLDQVSELIYSLWIKEGEN